MSGKRPDALAEPRIEQELKRVWFAFWDLFDGDKPIGFLEIQAFQNLMGFRFSWWESEILRRLSVGAFRQLQKG